MLSVHTFSSEGAGSVNAFALETDQALVAIDAQRQISQAKEFVHRLQLLGKPLTAILLTHEHPDHHGGLAAYQSTFGAAVPVLLTESTEREITTDARGFIQLAAGILKDDFLVPTRNTRLVRKGEVLYFRDLQLKVHDLGPGESASMSAFEVLGTGMLFCGDLVANGMTPFLFEGRSRSWVDQLKGFHQQFPQIETLYCGHGQPGPAKDLVAIQLEYLQRFRGRVAAAQNRGTLSEEQKAAIRTATESAYPTYQPVAEIPGFIEINAASVAAEIAKGEPA